MKDVTSEIRKTAGDGSVLESVRARYRDLRALVDAANAKIKTSGLQAKLDDANARAESARREAGQYAMQIQEIRGGGEAWLALKREIGQLARLLGGK